MLVEQWEHVKLRAAALIAGIRRDGMSIEYADAVSTLKADADALAQRSMTPEQYRRWQRERGERRAIAEVMLGLTRQYGYDEPLGPDQAFVPNGTAEPEPAAAEPASAQFRRLFHGFRY